MIARLGPLLLALAAMSAPVEPDRQGVLVLPAARATLHGPGLSLDAEQKLVQGWRDVSHRATWAVIVSRSQSYQVVVEFAMTGDGPGGPIRVRVGDESREAFASPTGSVERVLPQPLVDPVTLSPGRAAVSLEAPGLPARAFLSIRAVRLIPVSP